MKISKDFEISKLQDFGFECLIREELDDMDDSYLFENNWVFNIGHSRRGQFYYIIVDSKRNLSLYASQPDGSPGPIELPSVLIDLVKNGIIES